MPHVLIAGSIHGAGLELLRSAHDITFEVVESTSSEAYLPFVEQADAIVLRTQPMTAEVIRRAPRLRIVSRHGVGYDAVDVAALSQRGIPLTIVGDVNSRSVAEHAIMLLMAVAKKAVFYDARTRAGDWDARNRLDTVELGGKRLLLLGFGRIGRLAAEMAAGFGMVVAAYDPFVTPADMTSRGIECEQDLLAALGRSDFVSVHMPRSGDEPLLGARHIQAMKPGAILVNTARGGIIDEQALASALQSGHLRGAGLDVLAREPMQANDPLLACGNVLISPHSAGLTEEAAMRMSVAAVTNVLKLFAGQLDSSLVVNAQALEPKGTEAGSLQ